MPNPLPPDAEQIAPGEDAELAALALQLRDIQRANARRQPLGRALHNKGHGGLRATLETLDNTPDWARVGIFGAAAAYRAYVRFSNGSGRRKNDDVGDVRGVAVKVVGVPGKKLIPGLEDAVTQDFLAILTSTVPFPTPAEFVGVVRAASGPPLLALPRLMATFGLLRFVPMLRKMATGLRAPVSSLAERTFHSALPIRWGDTAVKYRLSPVSIPEVSALTAPGDADRLARDLSARAAAGPLVYTLDVQGYLDAATTPIEDPTVEWDPAATPFVPVARLTVHQQDTTSAAGRALTGSVEAMSFDPWHAPVEFRPLGALMRARAHAYRESVIERGAASEPDGSEDWPA